MLNFIDLIDVTDSAANDLKAAVSLFNVIKDKMFELSDFPEENDPFDMLGYRQGIQNLLLAMDGFELSLECVRRTLAEAYKEANESREQT